jgi:hypothetical protein
MKFLSCFILLLCVSFYCLAENDIGPLGENEGYVILPLVVSGLIPESVTIADSNLFGNSYKVENIKGGNNFNIIRLPAGEYKWSKVRLHKSHYFNLKDKEFNLTVKSGVINYGGHLIVEINPEFGTANLNYVNRSSQIIKELEECCINLMVKYQLTFAGNSEDPFIEFYRAVIAGRVSK